MRKSISISDEQMRKYLMDFFNYFETGYDFEKFLKVYLEKMGLDEVVVTQRTRDGGIDLKAIRNGIGGFSEADVVNYYVQAKRNKPDGAKISVTKIRELKGTIPFGSKGIFITTATFSKESEKEAFNDISKPVILIDGRRLIESCIDNEIGFVFSPVFSKTAMDKLQECQDSRTESSDKDRAAIVIDKVITRNDIRARIISIPREILIRIPNEKNKIEVIINNDKYICKVNRNRGYLSGVTAAMKKNGLIDNDGVYNVKKATWCLSGAELSISIMDDDSLKKNYL